VVYPYRDQHVWTPEQKVRVCVLYTEGVSFTLIAERMTTEIRMAVSKNMIAGLIGRLVKAKKVERRHDEPKPLSDARKKPKAEKPAGNLTSKGGHQGLKRQEGDTRQYRNAYRAQLAKNVFDAGRRTPSPSDGDRARGGAIGNAGYSEQVQIERETAPLERATFSPRFKSEPCCYPLGEPKTPGFRLCDEPSVPGRSPYCEKHKKASWVTWASIKAKQEAQQERRA
jgi:GcrA cell cycle regulator